MAELSKCKITVIKRTLNKDLVDDYIKEKYQDIKPCERFEDGQEFELDPNKTFIPENFCEWAWADIRKDLLTIASGGNMVWYKDSSMTIAGCTDWFRPVYFKIERIE